MILKKGTKSHHTQSVTKNSVHKLLFSHVLFLETQCSYIIIKTYESTISVIQLYILLIRDNESISMQFNILKLNPSSPSQSILASHPYGLSPFKMTKTPTPLKIIFENQKFP